MTVRTRLAALTAVALLTAGVVGWQLLDPGPLHRIVVSNGAWNRSDDWQIEIDDANRYVFRHGADETRGRITFAPFAQRLAAVREIRWTAASASAGKPGLAFWIEGGRRTIAPFILGEGGDHAALRSFAAALHDAVAADARRQDAPRIGALTSLRDLRAVEIVSNGCFGTCGSYTIVFHHDRTGELDWSSFPNGPRRRSSAVEWQLVLRNLHAAHVERLGRKYPAHAIDTQSAALRFVFARVTYSVEAPDSSTWPPEFAAAFASMRHLAAGTAWSPPLDANQVRPLSH